MGSDNLTERLANLSPAKRALLEFRLMEKGRESAVTQNIPRRFNRDAAPLSFAQQRLWFLNQLEPESSAYNESSAVRLSGSVDIVALNRALNQLITRHEVLRTTIVSGNGGPRQVIAKNRELQLPIIDLRQLPEAGRESEARRLMIETVRKTFDLSQDLMLRVLLLQLADQEHIFLVVKHHVASDGWSTGILWRELTSLYRTSVSGEPSPLPELPIQYSDYAVWQKEWLKGAVLERQLSYWKKQLAGIGFLQLPTDRPRPAVQSYRGARQCLPLPDALWEKLNLLSRREQVTLFMTLLAAFQTLLYRYTGQNDVAVGCPIAGRTRQELEGLIGFFVNTLVMRLNFSGNPTFRELLARVRAVALEAYAHQDLPFEKLVEEIQPERNLSHSPLFQVVFAYQNTPKHALDIPGVLVTPVEKHVDSTKFDLHLSLNSADEGIGTTLYYATDLFDRATIVRMMGHFRELLESIVTKPERRVSDLPMLTRTEKHQLLVEWNDTRRNYPKDKCIHQLFEDQVERTPEAIAVVYEDQQLTYRALNTRANQLAHYLRKLGVGPETLIGICVERSLEMVVGLLGILKAGGAYVPLDPDYPKERLRFMLEDTRMPVLLTQQHCVDRLPDHRTKVICLDTDWGEIAKQSGEDPSTDATATNLVYVIYTSGSTGQPKGVLSAHGGIVNRLLWMQDAYHLTPGDRVLQKTPFSFDVSVWEFFWPLINGASLVVALPYGHQDAEYLVKLICEREITTLHFVPSMLHSFLEAQGVEQCKSLGRVICSGETLPLELQQRFFARLPISLCNLYGPTEASVDVTSWICQTSGTRHVVPIGRPIANTQSYLLDTHLSPVPIGVTGELCIGGDGLARGYLNRPELTAEKFIPNPFSEDPGARLYKTGDLARYLPDGNIEFLGRMDHQVKIRGFRIELGEIEAVLAQHPAVKETVVLARDDIDDPESESENSKLATPKSASSNKRLLAYVTSRKQEVCKTRELREFLKQKLPDYMVPAVFVFLDFLPLSSNGKVDRKALPRPDYRPPESEENFAAPSTPVEELLANIWAEVLKLEKVGVRDNFFDLGGHSLLAIQVVSRIRKQLQVALTLRKLFEGPTVGELATYIKLARQQTAELRALPIVRQDIDKECPLSFSQERFWFLDQLEPNNPAYQVTYRFHLIGALIIEALENTLSETVRRHEALRTTFHLRNGKPVQVISEQWSSPLTIIDLRQYPRANLQAEVERLLETEHQRSFDLSADLLLRATLLQLAADEHVLVLSTHHIVWDHWCIEILFREFAVLYRAYAAGQLSPLPDPPIQYRHYALWQHEVFDRAELQNHVAYWKEQLRAAPRSLNLPTDHPRKRLHKRRGGRESTILPQRLISELEALSQKFEATLFMVFLAAFQTLLCRITGQEDIVVGTPIALRDRFETEGLIGVFLNTLVFRTNLCGNPTFVEVLRRVRNVALGAYDHQDLPFEKLVEELQPERDLIGTPIVQVFINQYNFKEASLEFDGLSVTRLKAGTSAPQFDLECGIREHDDGTHLTIVYDLDLFNADTIERMVGYFQTLLEGIATNPEQQISDLPLLTASQKEKVLVEWNDTKADYPKEKCIYQLFEDQVEKSPDAVAVLFESQQLTYRELNKRANQLAHYLRQFGVGPEVLVGICAERSLEMVVGLLGIIKAGGAYVPLDPEYPKERLAFMLQDSRAQVLLTQERLIGELPVDKAHVVCLDRDWEQIAAESDEQPVPTGGMTSNNLAYVVYTSGSTGHPKGVEVRHQGVLRLLIGVDYVRVDAQQTFLQLAPISFDASTFEIWGALCHGARCVLFPGKIPSPRELGNILRQYHVRTLWLTASLYNTVVDEAPEALSEVRQLLIGGEALSVSRVQRALELLPGTQIINGYGPTESTTFTCCYAIPPGLDGKISSIPIGRPISNTEVYLLDTHLSPVPIGVMGELCIGGDGLARGYLNRPKLTAEKFIPNPFSEYPGARLYKTGDLARYLPDGNIEFLGRIDHQVKIRGFRIELGEIEAVLAQHPPIREAVVLACENNPGDKQVVAYVVPEQGASSTADELRAFLKHKLPDYMVPSMFVFMDAMPLTPNGKLDRKALPAPDRNNFERANGFVAPRTLMEEMLVEIWAEVLKLDKIGIHDNFFHIGGHSLKATQVISRIRETFRMDLSLRVLFEAPTVAELAMRVEQSVSGAGGPEELARLMAEVDVLSDEEMEHQLEKNA